MRLGVCERVILANVTYVSLWQDLYMALQAFSFKTKDIEDAMTNTLLHGGDLHSALDWLCLNLSDGKQDCH